MNYFLIGQSVLGAMFALLNRIQLVIAMNGIFWLLGVDIEDFCRKPEKVTILIA
jgi:hypothetical protein